MSLLRKFSSIFLLFIFPFLLKNAFGQEREPIIVSTKYGKLRGFVHLPSDAVRKINVFFGIPYAKAPLGELRFESPLAPSKWINVREAGEAAKPPACPPHGRPDPQLDFNEDCLFVNVFAPHRAPDDQSLFPVLFVIHGGAYELGSSATYFNYDLLGARFVSRGVLIVSINYRLGVLGFGTTGDKDFPGNYGIRDQIAALEYVKENIQAFGGDPNKVTVLGYSAGSGSTGLLSLTPLAKDLFQQTVRMSGAILSGSCSGRRVPKVTRELADVLNCGQSTPLKKCLQQKRIDEIFEGVEKMGAAPISYIIAKFSPNRMDHSLFPLEHSQALEKAPPKRTMLGFTELDFLLMTLVRDRNSSMSKLALTDEQIANYGQTHFEAFLRNYVAKSAYFGDQSNAIRADLFDFYANKYYETIEESEKDAAFFLRLYSMVCSDLMMVVPLLWETQIRVGHAEWPIYLYEFKYFNDEVFPKRAKVHVAYHGYDHGLLFDKELIKNAQDNKVSAFLIDSVVNFVKNGDPSNNLAKWETTPAFSLSDAKSISHMEIGANPMQKQGMQGELKRLHFWMEMRQKYGDKYDLVRGIFGNGTAANSGRAWGINVWMIAIIAISVALLIANSDYLYK